MKERTFAMIKPDGVKRNLVGEIIRRFENAGLKVVALKMIRATKERVFEHYPMETMLRAADRTKEAFEREGKEFPWTREEYANMIRNFLLEYITEGPVVPMVLEGENAIEVARKIRGYTDPSRAEKGTISGDFGEDSYEKANSENRAVRNLCHVADRESAEREIKIWFGEDEIFED